MKWWDMARSTAEQASNGTSIEIQRRAVERVADANAWDKAPESWGFNGVLSLIKHLTKAESLVTVGPVGLEPTTYGLQIWLLAMQITTRHHLAQFPYI
jgi:hypothetical protein